jgi:hypothetical protein
MTDSTATSISVLLHAPLVQLPDGTAIAAYRDPNLADMVAAAMVSETDEDGDVRHRYSVAPEAVPAWLAAIADRYHCEPSEGQTAAEAVTRTLIACRENIYAWAGRLLGAEQYSAALALRAMPEDQARELLGRVFSVEGRRSAPLCDAILPGRDTIALRIMQGTSGLDTNALDSDRHQGHVRVKAGLKLGPSAAAAVIEGRIR